jgi:hypothetical protein
MQEYFGKSCATTLNELNDEERERVPIFLQSILGFLGDFVIISRALIMHFRGQR